MRQILYVSVSSVPGDGGDLARILQTSRHNNALDGLTGLLWSDGRSFLQVIEGPAEVVADTFARIVADPRHHSLKLLSDRMIDEPEFGSWTMAHRRDCDLPDAYDAQMRRALARASGPVRDRFMSLVATGATVSAPA